MSQEILAENHPAKIFTGLDGLQIGKTLNWLQAARFVAAFTVILHQVTVHQHNFFGAKLGLNFFLSTYFWAQGVDLFFAISGFVMAAALLSGKPGVFLKNRFLRIYVPFFLAVGLALAIQQLFLGQIPELKQWPKALQQRQS